MASLVENAAETAKVLGISKRDALALEFLAAKAWAHIKGDAKAEAVMTIGASHALGKIDGATMRQCLQVVG